MKQAPLELDYVVAPRRPIWLGLLLLVVALGIATDLVLRFGAARDERSGIETGQSPSSTDRSGVKSTTGDRVEEQVRSAEAVVRQLTLPWAALIEALEVATTKDVAMLLVQPEAQQQLLRITAEARDYEAMFRYLHNLSGGGALQDVHLLNHQMRLEDPKKPLQFSVQATFKVAP